MANAKKVRDRKFPQTDFEMTIDEAVAQLIKASQIAVGDRWSFQVSGDLLIITRIRATEETPILDP